MESPATEPEIRLMASCPSLVSPSGRFEMKDSSKFPSVKIPRFVSGRLQVGINDARNCCRFGDKVDMDLHTQQVTLLPTSTEGLSIPSALLFRKDQNTR